MPPPTRRAEVEESVTPLGVRNTLRLNTVACAEAWRTGFAIVRIEELGRVRGGTGSSNDGSSSWR